MLRQQQGEDVDKALRVALWDKADQSAAYKTPRASERVKEQGIKT